MTQLIALVDEFSSKDKEIRSFYWTKDFKWRQEEYCYNDFKREMLDFVNKYEKKLYELGDLDEEGERLKEDIIEYIVWVKDRV